LRSHLVVDRPDRKPLASKDEPVRGVDSHYAGTGVGTYLYGRPHLR
jgi:hypothetical protein